MAAASRCGYVLFYCPPLVSADFAKTQKQRLTLLQKLNGLMRGVKPRNCICLEKSKKE